MIHHQHHGEQPCVHCANDALRAEVERLTRFEDDVFKALNPECPAHPGIVNPCPPAMCDCFAADDMVATINALKAEVERLRSGMTADNDEICQVLGRALGYPWFEDDPKNFPGATESNGVCVGDHIAVTLAVEAAQRVAATFLPPKVP